MNPQTWEQGIAQAAEVIKAKWGSVVEADPIESIEARLGPLRGVVRKGRIETTHPSDHQALATDYALMGAAALLECFLTDPVDRLAPDILDDICHFVASKQRDYGTGNILAFEHLGLVVRISDKVARIRNLEKRGSDGTVEPLADAWVDIVGYCLVGLMLLDGTFHLPLAEDLEAHLAAAPSGVDGAGPWRQMDLREAS